MGTFKTTDFESYFDLFDDYLLVDALKDYTEIK